MKTTVIFFAGLLAASIAGQASAQVYRCQGAAGVVMQQAPCAGHGEKLDVRPASGHMSPAQSQALGTPSNQGSAARQK